MPRNWQFSQGKVARIMQTIRRKFWLIADQTRVVAFPALAGLGGNSLFAIAQVWFCGCSQQLPQPALGFASHGRSQRQWSTH
jgi:hypothetical protein